MAAKSVVASKQDWERLSRAVVDRRLALGLGAADLARLSGVSASVISILENARQENLTGMSYLTNP